MTTKAKTTKAELERKTRLQASATQSNTRTRSTVSPAQKSKRAERGSKAKVDTVTPPAPTPGSAVVRRAERAPWAKAHPQVKLAYQMRLPQELHMQLAWLAAHLPKTSMHKLMLDAIAQRTETLLAKHYKTSTTK